MKQFSSRFLKTVAALHLGFPITYLLLVLLLFNVPASHLIRIILSPLFILTTVLGVVVGWGLWEMKRWAWYVFLVFVVIVGYENALVVTTHSVGENKILAFVASIIMLLFLVLRVGKEVKVPYFLPKIRWWESNPRYKLIVPGTILRSDQTPLEGEVLDLSLGGCFFKCKHDFKDNEEIHLSFKIFEVPVEFQGSVVWRTESAVTHPKGIGVKFSPLSKDLKKTMKAVCVRLNEISVLYRSSRYLMNQEEFYKKMTLLQTEKLNIPDRG